MVVYGGDEPYRLAALPPQEPEPSVQEAREQPSMLLRAADGLIAFTGREAELRDLRVWRDAAASDAMKVRLIHAAGGQGKTRLAGHVADLWQREGWLVLAAHHRRDRSAPEVLHAPDMRDAAGFLVTVDYAERWDTADLLTLLTDVQVGAAATGVPVRVLLLARPAGTWWQSLDGRIRRDVGVVPSRWELEPLEDGPSLTRNGLFIAARDRFADLLGMDAAKGVEPPAALARHEAYRMVLTVHMAAMAAVLGHGGTTDPPVDPREVSALLLSRERDHWEAMHAPTREKALDTTADAMGQMVYLATLTGPLGHPTAKSAVARAAVESKEAAGQLLKDHGICYPPAGGTRGPDREAARTVLQPLYPDRLGEDFVALLTPGHDHDFPADEWADGAPARLLAPGPEVPVWAAHALTTLVETARRWPHLARDQLFPLLTTHPRLALEATGATLAALVDLEGIDVELLRSIEVLVPEHRNADLDVGIAALASRVAERNLAEATSPAERARIHGMLSIRLRNSGLHADALDAGLRALEIWRELAESEPAHHRELATSLGNQANLLAESGRRDEALVMSRLASRMWLELSEEAPGAYEADAVRTLSNHANRLAEVGLQREAVALSEKVLVLCEALAAGDWDAHAESLGDCLDNHAVWLSAVGKRREGLPVSERALTVRRRLAELDHGAHATDLAASLQNHSALLGRMGRLDEALSVSTEAADLGRRLVEANRKGHLPRFAGVLTNRATVLAALGRRQEAESPSGESVDLHRELVTGNRAAHLPGLAASVNNHAMLLRELSRGEDSVPFSREAIELYRELAAVNPGAFRPSLAQAFANHAVLLSGLGRTDEAVAVSEEAYVLWRRLAETDRELYGRQLATSSNNHAVWLRERGRLDEAVPFSREAISLYGEAADTEPDAYLPMLAMALDNHVRLLTQMECHSEAELPAVRAAGLHRKLAEADESHLPRHLDALAAYGRVLIGAGRFAEAVEPLAHALPATRRLPGDGRGTVAVLVDLLRRARAGDPVAVADRFRSCTGVDVPEWMEEPPAPG